MRPAAVLVAGFSGIALWGLALLIGSTYVTGRNEASSPSPAPDPGAAVTQARNPVIEDRPVRVVSPEQFGSPIVGTATALERIEPREPLHKSTEPEPVKVAMLPRPQTTQAGQLTSGGREVQFFGVVPTEPTRQCRTDSGGEWPCGMVARTQQRLFIRNRTVACENDRADWQGVLVTRCRIGNVDIAEWLVRNGWVEAEQGSSLAALSEQARTGRVGIFGNDTR
ncbi:MAG TPA: hypothetical protein DIC56_18520 [Rhizobium sp.]|nr:hypothetical protein [Rhizobium sp.]